MCVCARERERHMRVDVRRGVSDAAARAAKRIKHGGREREREREREMTYTYTDDLMIIIRKDES